MLKIRVHFWRVPGRLSIPVAFWCCALLCADWPTTASEFDEVVLPVLRDRCFECHRGEHAKADLRFDVGTAALRGGDSGPAIVPGKSASSLLIERVESTDKDLMMPPKGKRLSPKEIAAFRQWIDAGASWPATADLATDTKAQAHWSLQLLARPAVPQHVGGSVNPIDAFIDSQLLTKGMVRSAEADRRTLIRRLSFDLIGLPPTPAETQAFLDDRDPTAYAKLVDRLLESPRYGEHWARHWLDVVHYADTHGNDHDYYRPNAWPYRDYVIESLNNDKPYSRFVAEQVAGDVLFPADPQATVALGFLAAGPWDHTLIAGVREDTVDHRMGRNLDRDDMVSTVMSSFNSLTVHCARCHNHKFDPISQREYYALQAVFAGVDRADRNYDRDPQVTARRRELQARKLAVAAKDPVLWPTLDSAELSARIIALAESFDHRNGNWQMMDVVSAVSSQQPKETVFTREADGSWFVSGASPDKDEFTIIAQTKLTEIRGLRLEVLPDPRLPQGGPGRYANGNFHLSQFRATAQPLNGDATAATKLELSLATADHGDVEGEVTRTLDDKPETFWSINPRYNETHEAIYQLKQHAGFDGGTTVTVSLQFHGKPGHQIGRFRLWATREAGATAPSVKMPPEIATILRIPFPQMTVEQRRVVALHLLAAEVERDLAAVPAQTAVFAATSQFTPEGSFKPSAKPRSIHLLARGDINKPGEEVGPGTLSCISNLSSVLEMANAGDETLRRAAMANWLIDDRNVLTWRSIVNRVWHYHFGRGLCDTPNDFGKMGGRPTHPELLDWLAVWFRDEAKGSLKSLHRQIVLSATYRQTSDGAARLTNEKRTPDGKVSGYAQDSDNRQLWRMNRNRITGEILRDAVLQTSGRLDLKMGGPAEVQFLNEGIAKTFKPVTGAPPIVDYEHFDPDAAENNRRAIYRFVFRTVPDPLMDAIDCPDGGAMTPVRSVSTTPLQALAVLNNSFLLRQCEHIAARITREASDPENHVTLMFQLMLQRNPTAAETSAFREYMRQHGLANACHVLLNSNEFFYPD